MRQTCVQETGCDTDFDSHAITITVPESLNATALLGEAVGACPLPRITGGKATWIIYIGQREEHCLGVMAQEWPGPELLFPVKTTAKEIFSDRAHEMFFCYWCQADPHRVLDAVRYNKPLPDKYSS